MNAKTARPPSESSTLPVDEESRPTDSLAEQPLDGRTSLLAGYRVALEDFGAAREKVGTLREVEASLRGQIARLELDREESLSKAASLDTEEGIDELTRLSAKLEVSRRKLADVSARLLKAEQALETEQSGILSGFRLLWLSFKDWTFGREKSRLIADLVPGCDDLTIDRVTMFYRRVDTVRALEVAVTDPEGVTSRAQRLLDVVTGYPGFTGPPYSPPQATLRVETAKGAPGDSE